MRTNGRELLVLVGFLTVTFLVAGISGAATSGAVRDWYQTIAKPAWNPPSWVFGPVWTVLYATMAVAAWFVWRRAGWSAPLTWWAVQLGLNAFWSPLFFGCQRIDLALVDIVALWGAILATVIMFWRVSPGAGATMVPYLLWVSFAAVLNFTLWRLNR